MKEKQEKISEKLRLIREQNNLNLSEMGRQLGISHTAVSKLEDGKSLPGLSTLHKLWRIFGVKPNEIVSLYENEIKNTIPDGQTLENR